MAKRCAGERAVLGLELDKDHHSLFVAFSSCIIRVPLSRCAQHTTCKRHCLQTHDPYCIWLRTGRCADVAPGFKAGFEQDIDGDQSHSFDTCSDGMSAAGSDVNSAVDSVSGVKQLPDGLHYTLLGTCVLVAFVLGAVVSGLLVSCYCAPRSQRSAEPEASLQHTLSLGSLAKLNRLVDSKPSQIYSAGPPCRQPPDKPLPEEEELTSNLPTPDSTPELPIKNLKALNSQWERSHTHSATLQLFPTNQMLPSEHDDPDFAIMTSSSGSLRTPTSYYSCLKETAESFSFQQTPLQTLPERQVLIKIDNSVTTTRKHSFNQKPSHAGNLYELHRPLMTGGSCLTRQHSYSEPPLLQRAAIIRRTASLKPQIPPKPTHIPPKTLQLPSHAKHSC